MSLINFIQTNSENYNNLEIKDENSLYFLSDTQEIYKGNIKYAKGINDNYILTDEDKNEISNNIIENFDKEILELLGGESNYILNNQEREEVKNYLNETIYDPLDYSTTNINNYVTDNPVIILLDVY